MQTTPIEERYLAEMLRRLRRLDNTDGGVFAEIIVADSVPGAMLPDESWGPVDVGWNGIAVQVKCSGERQSWHPPGKPPTPAQWSVPKRGAWDATTDTFSEPGRFADVYVLDRHAGYDYLVGWTFDVLGRSNQGFWRRLDGSVCGLLPPAVDLCSWGRVLS